MSTCLCPHLNKLMPVLYWFTWIGQHGRPVLPPGTIGFAAHTTHPYNLVMTDADIGDKERKENIFIIWALGKRVDEVY